MSRRKFPPNNPVPFLRFVARNPVVVVGWDRYIPGLWVRKCSKCGREVTCDGSVIDCRLICIPCWMKSEESLAVQGDVGTVHA